jgi:hypothetical protein
MAVQIAGRSEKQGQNNPALISLRQPLLPGVAVALGDAG